MALPLISLWAVAFCTAWMTDHWRVSCVRPNSHHEKNDGDRRPDRPSPRPRLTRDAPDVLQA